MNGVYQQIQEPTRNEIVSVGTSSTIVSESRNQINPRKTIIIRNNSDDPSKIITINFGFNQAINNAGIVLKQYESITDNTETGYECFQGVITGICAVAGGSLSIMER